MCASIDVRLTLCALPCARHRGLDALSAAIVIGVLRKIADETGMTVIVTIHQPSRDLFETFDNLLLLQVCKRHEMALLSTHALRVVRARA